MPKKSRKSRGKYKIRSKPLAVKEVRQSPPPWTPSLKQVSVAKSPLTIAGQADRLRNIPQELRRILFIAGALLVLLIVLSLFLR